MYNELHGWFFDRTGENNTQEKKEEKALKLLPGWEKKYPLRKQSKQEEETRVWRMSEVRASHFILAAARRTADLTCCPSLMACARCRSLLTAPRKTAGWCCEARCMT